MHPTRKPGKLRFKLAKLLQSLQGGQCLDGDLDSPLGRRPRRSGKNVSKSLDSSNKCRFLGPTLDTTQCPGARAKKSISFWFFCLLFVLIQASKVSGLPAEPIAIEL